MKKLTVSLVILTYKRKELMLSLIEGIAPLKSVLEEIIIVDNQSGEGLAQVLALSYPDIDVLTLNNNLGTEGRNIGIKQATSDLVVLLDDDVFGLTKNHIELLVERFAADAHLAALCFKVVHAESESVINWCHHKPRELFADSAFETYEITEGAVAVKRELFLAVGGFPGHFFISHEGPDLALRLIDAGYKVCYEPKIAVKHHQSTLGRASWRRYYYDTRNVIWLAVRNYPVLFALRFLCVQLAAMLVYSVRDGFFSYFCKAIYESLRDIKPILKERKVISSTTLSNLKALSAEDESVIQKIKKRVFRSGVGI